MSQLHELLLRHCGHGGGGTHTNFDPYHARPLVGLADVPWRSICWRCYREWGSELSALMDKELKAALRASAFCGYLEPYRGYCMNERPCREHAHQRCWKCGGQATSGCSQSGSLVCGVSQCDEHDHSESHREAALRRQVEDQAKHWGL